MKEFDREKIAAEMHAIWAHWMRYLLARCDPALDDDMLIPSYFVERWQRQMNMDYEQMSERDKMSDRQQADRIIAVICGK